MILYSSLSLSDSFKKRAAKNAYSPVIVESNTRDRIAILARNRDYGVKTGCSRERGFNQQPGKR